MTEDEFFKLYPNYLKDKRFVDENGNINSPALQNAIKNKYGLPLNELTEEDLNKGLFTKKTFKVNIPTLRGTSGELDLGNMARTFLQGVTFGYGDEIEASLSGSDVSTIREEINNYTKENPKSALALELSGGITGSAGGLGVIKGLGGLGVKTLISKFPQSLQRLNKFIKTRQRINQEARLIPTRETVAATTAGGALYASGKQDDTESTLNVPLIDAEVDKTVAGGAVAGALSLPLTIITRLPVAALSSAADAVSYFATKKLPLSNEEKILKEFLEESADPEKELRTIRGQLKAYKDSPVTLQDIGSRSMQSLSKNLIRSGREATKDIILDFTEKRSKQATNRVKNQILNITGRKVDPNKSLENIQTDLGEISSRLYSNIMDKPVAVTGELRRIMKFPKIKEGIEEAKDIIRNNADLSSEEQTLLINNLDALTKGNIKFLDVKTLDQIKRGLDTIVKKQEDGFGRLDLSNPSIKNIVKLKKNFTNAIDKAAEKTIGTDYKLARGAYADGLQKIDAFNYGSKFIKGGGNYSKQKEFYSGIDKMSEEEKFHFILGVQAGLDDMVASSLNPNAIVKNLLQKPSFDKALNVIFDKSRKGQIQKRKFKQFLQAESAILETNRRNLGGSDTAANLIAAKNQGIIASDLIDGASYLAFGTGPITQILGASKIAKGFGQGSSISPETEEGLARLLTQTDKSQIARTLDRIQPNYNKRMLGELLRRGTTIGSSAYTAGNLMQNRLGPFDIRNF
tara:strand:- start:93 stop:2324 length:2232 start_codon:yes stop_codon:yes gene_type:complete